jgi:hypothetical protein
MGQRDLLLSGGSESDAVCANTPGKVAGRHLGRIIAREGPLSRPQEPTEDRVLGTILIRRRGGSFEPRPLTIRMRET